MLAWIVGALALVVTGAICWRWDIALLGGDRGLHGWGFPIFGAVYVALYFPIAFVAKRRNKNDGKK